MLLRPHERLLQHLPQKNALLAKGRFFMPPITLQTITDIHLKMLLHFSSGFHVELHCSLGLTQR